MREVAIHEAGHAVIARVLSIQVDRATIRPNEFSSGHVVHEARGEDNEEWWWETAGDYAKVALAGPIAHMKYRPTVNGERFADDLLYVAMCLQIASGFTRTEVLVLGRPLQQDNARASQLWERLQADTADLVELHWLSIERVAEALLIHETLGPEELDALMH